jgi:phospholipid transport system substrate-binding protein
MKKILTIILLLNLGIGNAYSLQPDVFVQSTVNRASEILSKNITKKEKIDGLKIIAKETVDIEGVGFYSLGSARKVLNDNQKQKYFELFEDYFLKVFQVDCLNILIQKLRFGVKK